MAVAILGGLRAPTKEVQHEFAWRSALRICGNCIATPRNLPEKEHSAHNSLQCRLRQYCPLRRGHGEEVRVKEAGYEAGACPKNCPIPSLRFCRAISQHRDSREQFTRSTYSLARSIPVKTAWSISLITLLLTI